MSSGRPSCRGETEGEALSSLGFATTWVNTCFPFTWVGTRAKVLPERLDSASDPRGDNAGGLIGGVNER